jgi:hypothetical protein
LLHSVAKRINKELQRERKRYDQQVSQTVSLGADNGDWGYFGRKCSEVGRLGLC